MLISNQLLLKWNYLAGVSCPWGSSVGRRCAVWGAAGFQMHPWVLVAIPKFLWTPTLPQLEPMYLLLMLGHGKEKPKRQAAIWRKSRVWVWMVPCAVHSIAWAEAPSRFAHWMSWVECFSWWVWVSLGAQITTLQLWFWSCGCAHRTLRAWVSGCEDESEYRWCLLKTLIAHSKILPTTGFTSCLKLLVK